MTLKYQSSHLEAMKVIAISVKDQSLLSFEKAKETFKTELSDDFILKNHIHNLY